MTTYGSAVYGSSTYGVGASATLYLTQPAGFWRAAKDAATSRVVTVGGDA